MTVPSAVGELLTYRDVPQKYCRGLSDFTISSKPKVIAQGTKTLRLTWSLRSGTGDLLKIYHSDIVRPCGENFNRKTKELNISGV